MVALILTLILSCVLIKDDNVIYWSESYKLNYDDFKKEVPCESAYNGMAATGFKYSYKLRNDSLFVKVTTIFRKNESWLSLRDSATLKHEQGHFDISEVYGRKLRKEIIVLCQSKIDKSIIFLQISTLYRKILAECNSEQDAYDDATNGLNKKQEIWNERIKSYLNEYASFKESNLEFGINKD